MLVLLSAAIPFASVRANPGGGSVTHGAATITQVPNNTAVTGISNRAVIDWNSFSIGAGETTSFTFSAAGGAVLNRVTGNAGSNINGLLTSGNGSVYLVNPNGVIVGPSGVVNVAGSFVASTLDVDSTQFMSGGDLDFQGNSLESVVNRGSITAVEGDVFLIGAHVANHGTIDAAQGTVGLGAGNDVKLVDSAHPHLVVQPTAASLGGTGAENTGTIDALRAELAAAGGNVYALAINNEGTIRSNCAVSKDGRIYLTSEDGRIGNSGELIATCNTFQGFTEPVIEIDAGTEGEVALSGIVRAEGTAGNAQGGDVKITGGSVDMTDLRIDVSNPVAGTIRVDAVGQTPGGGDITGEPASFFGSVRLLAKGSASQGDHIVLDAAGNLLLSDLIILETTEGNIDLTAGDDIVLSTGSSFDLVNIFAESGEVNMTAENVVLDSFSSIFGIEVGSLHGATSVVAEDSVILIADNGGSARIGREGVPLGNAADGDIVVGAGGEVILSASGAGLQSSVAQIGNAARPFSSASGETIVLAEEGVTLVSSEEGLALIGHLGTISSGGLTGNTLVATEEDVLLTAEEGSHSHIGHFSNYGDLEGHIAVLAGDDIQLAAESEGAFAQIGHRLVCDNFGPPKVQIEEPFGEVAGDIAVIAGEDVCLYGEEGSLALIGHENCVNPEATIESNILVAYSQRRLNDLKECNLRYDFNECIECLLPRAQSILPEGEGIFCMTPNSRIGGKVGIPVDGYVMIYGWREKIGEQETATLIDDGAVINSLVMNSGIAPGSTQGIYFNQSEPYVNWKHEQYGFSLLDLVCRPETVAEVYGDPFTIYYPFLCDQPDDPEEPDFHWEDPWWPYWPEYPYDARYCGCPETGGLAGTNSYQMYNPICGDCIPCVPCPCGPALPLPCVPAESLETEPLEEPTPAEPVKLPAPKKKRHDLALLSSQ